MELSITALPLKGSCVPQVCVCAGMCVSAACIVLCLSQVAAATQRPGHLKIRWGG